MKVISTLFLSADGRPRAGWRLLLQVALAVIFMIPLYYLVSLAGGRNLQIVAGGAAVTLAVWVAGWMLDKRPIRDFGMQMDRRWWRDCLEGILMAFFVMSLMVLFLWLMGWIEFTGFGWNRSSERSFVMVFTGYVLTMAVVGFYEELWSRGYQLKNLTEGFFNGKNRNIAVLMAIAASSFFFGILHLGNPNATIFGLAVIILAGIMLALPYVVTGQLGYSIGIHFAWNAVQGALYGLPVSGIPFRQSVLQFDVNGPVLWTGGHFGPEGGLVGVIGVILLIFISVLLLRYRGYRMEVSEELIRPPEQGY